MHVLLASLALASAPAAVPASHEQAVLERVTADLCDKDVAAIGETAGHGDGRAIAFKAALVERLVDRCGFDAVFFESSSYDFLELERRRRRGEAVTRQHLASAIGGLWNRYAEMQGLIDFLHGRSVRGRLRLGGLDDQLGSAGAFYSISEMPTELTGLLRGARAGRCREEFRRTIYGETPPEAAARAPLIGCLAAIRTALGRAASGRDRMERLHMVANIERYLTRSWTDEEAHARARDQSMWLNYQWLRGRLPRGSKVILWGATAHLSREAAIYPPFRAGGNFGEYLGRLHGRGIFFLGFGAAAGEYLSGGARGRIEPAAAGSLEEAALRGGGEVAYVDGRALGRFGYRAGGLFAHTPIATDWSRVVDGVVVFREERAPAMVAPPRP